MRATVNHKFMNPVRASAPSYAEISMSALPNSVEERGGFCVGLMKAIARYATNEPHDLRQGKMAHWRTKNALSGSQK